MDPGTCPRLATEQRNGKGVVPRWLPAESLWGFVHMCKETIATLQSPSWLLLLEAPGCFGSRCHSGRESEKKTSVQTSRTKEEPLQVEPPSCTVLRVSLQVESAGARTLCRNFVSFQHFVAFSSENATPALEDSGLDMRNVYVNSQGSQVRCMLSNHEVRSDCFFLWNSPHKLSVFLFYFLRWDLCCPG